MRTPRTRPLQGHFVFALKWLGVCGLAAALVLAFAVSAGVTNSRGIGLALLMTGLAFPVSLILLDDMGRPRALLRPRSFVGAVLGFLLVLGLGGVMVLQVTVTLAAINLADFLALTGLERVIDAIPRGTGRRALSAGTKAETVFAGFAMAGVVLPWLYACLMVLIVRFQDRDLRFASVERRAASPIATVEAPVVPTRVRPPELDAALLAMKVRMAHRQMQQRVVD